MLLSVFLLLSIAPERIFAGHRTSDYYSVIEELEFEVDATVVSAWDSFANLEFHVTNTGTDIIHNWYLTFDLRYDIEGVWGAAVYESDNEGVYTIKNAGWNQDIVPGAAICFGMTVSFRKGQSVNELPSFYLLNTKEIEVDPNRYTLTYHEYSNWESGFNGRILLINNSSDPIEDWSLSAYANRRIDEVAGADFCSSEIGITIMNNGASQNIEPHASVNLTVVGKGQNYTNKFEIWESKLKSVSCAFGLSIDTDSNGIADYSEFINNYQESQIVSPTPNPSPTPDPDVDSDDDGIPDYYERKIGTNPNSKDSDNDRIEDGIEVLLGYNPLSEDSNSDGISDAQEDQDEDGLSLEEELEQGTFPWSKDSDSDGILDGDELNKYISNPLEPDSDGDGITDGDEVKIGTNPTNTDSDENGVPDSQERFLQTREELLSNEQRPVITKVEVTLEGTGCLDTEMTIRDMYGIDTYSSELVGLIGVPVNIDYEGSFDEATITFHYDEDLLLTANQNIPDSIPVREGYKTNPASLGIFYLDESTGMFIDCEATVDTINHTITCTTTHFSEYEVVDKELWFYCWSSLKYSGELRPSHEGYQAIDYVLEIPYIESMTESDIREMNAIATKIIDNMKDGDRMVVRGYNTGGIYTYEYSIDKALLKSQVLHWPWNDGENWVGYQYGPQDQIDTDLSGMEIFNIAYSTNYHNKDNEIVIIAFHNSKDINCEFYSTDHRTRQEMTAYIFTLSSGDPSTESLNWLNHVAGGGVIDCEGKTAEDIYQEFVELYEKRQGKDEELGEKNALTGDGLWDIYESQGMLGGNGQFYYSDSLLKDSDLDGLTDDAEMGKVITVEVTNEGELYVDGELVQKSTTSFPNITWTRYKRFIEYGTGLWTLYLAKSDPLLTDTDEDYYSDAIDPSPKKSNIWTMGLGGIYDPSEDDKRFVGVYNHPGSGSSNPSYGGNQDWFGIVNKDSDDQYICTSGCGLISFSDVYSYLFVGAQKYDFPDYYDFVRNNLTLYGTAATPFGVFYGSMCQALEDLCDETGLDIDVYPHSINTNNPDLDLEAIVYMLRRLRPVIMSLCIDDDYALNYYEFSTSVTSSGKTLGDSNCGFILTSDAASQHYYTVTGVIFDDIADEAYLRVSNGGREQYIIFSEYIELVRDHRLLSQGPLTGTNYSSLMFRGWDFGNIIIVIT